MTSRKEWIATIRERRWTKNDNGEKYRWVVVTRFTSDDKDALMKRAMQELGQNEGFTVTISRKR